MHIFVDVAGQDDNLGDSVLRRGLLEALRVPSAELHVHTGDNSASYISGLGLRAHDVEYADRAGWRSSLIRETLRRRTHIAIDPGEIRSDAEMNFAGFRVILASAAVRARGGAVIHAGIGLRATTRPKDTGTRVLAAISSVTTWRDAPSQQRGRFGKVAPDWAFGTGTRVQSDSRTAVAITMRGDRTTPDQRWIDIVNQFVAVRGLSPVVFSQVRRDNALATWLHEQIDGSELMIWDDEVDHGVREDELRRLFGRSQCVISDRVHGLIMGATEGAVPIGLSMVNPEKLVRTLEGGGLSGFAFSVSSPDVLDRMTSLADRSDDVRAAVASSSKHLDEVTRSIHRSLGVRQQPG